MRKTHYEKLLKTGVNDLIKKVTAATTVLFGRSVSLSDLDSLQNSLQPLFPPALSAGPQGGTSLRSLMFYSFFSKKIFYLAEAFAQELRKIRITVKANCIPESNDIICIELPEWTGYQAVYIAAIRNIGRDSTGLVYCRLEMQFCRTDQAQTFDRVMIHFYSENDIIEDGLVRFGDRLPIPEDILKFAVNAYLYVHSGQPDLREYAPPPKPQSKKPKVLRQYQKKCEQESLLPVTLVGFNFKKETQVSAHFQGYWTGEGRKNFMLRWKEPYSKGNNLSEPS